ncbi:MAG: HlyD family efflux transporter periplasmic adaptor subunit [Oscillospiraceae bacterium]|nr:HlyD family efflux transporter periplasmic adaptor subunit [Oscillospiraceae bacterium]
MKKLLGKMPGWGRTLFIVLLSVLVGGGGIYGVLLLIRGNAAVNVYALTDVGQYSSSGNAQTDGRVTTDRVQSVYISNTQEVTEILVKEGQKVSVGDELIAFDTTLTDLELERKDIAVRQLELDLENAKKERQAMNSYQIYVPPQPTEEPELQPGNVGQPRKGSGTVDDPVVFLWNESCLLDTAFLSRLADSARAQGMRELYAVLEQRVQDSLQGGVVNAVEIRVIPREDDSWAFTVLPSEYDSSVPREEGEEEEPQEEPYTGPTYSWSELNSMKKEADKKIHDLELKLEMAKVELETVRHELESGTVKATIDGVVKTVRDIEEARSEGTPLILVSGGGGYMVTGALSETELDSMHVGDTVSLLSWESYETLDATIVSISPFPADSGYYHYSEGNQNVSLYPFTVSVGEDAKLREGEYVQLTYSPGGEGSGYFLMNPFVRSENGKSYVWALGEKGLEKRYVTTGSSLWGNYVQITSGLEGVEYLAFPYGRSLRDGQKAEIAGIESLYGY